MADGEKSTSNFADMTKADLVKLCTDRGLSVVGNKPDLVARLQKSVNEDDCDSDHDSDYTVQNNGNGHERHNGPVLTFRDFEETLLPFTGADGEDIVEWLSEFENVATMLNWNDQFRFVYGKRLIKGVAYKFVNWQQIRTYQQLRAALRAEFRVKTNSKVVHEKLRNRKKRKNESFKEYIYEMVNIARKIELDEMAVIEYIIDGIDDDERNKVVLYEAVNIEDLKKRILIYGKMCDAMKAKGALTETVQSASVDRSKKKTEKKIICYNCNSEGHIVRDCPNASNGIKCFKCNNFGHLKRDCPNATTMSVRSKNVSNIDIQIGNKKFNALFDTGAERSLMSVRVHELIGKPDLAVSFLVLCGLGGSSVKSRGYFKSLVTIQGDEYDIKFHVVPNNAIPIDVILGENLIQLAEAKISRSGLEVRKYEREGSVYQEEEAEHIRQILSISVDKSMDINEKNQSVLEKMIETYMPRKNVSTTIETKIVVTDDEPVYERARRLAPLEKDVLNKQVDEWLRDGIIRPSRSNYASPVVLVRKKNGSYRVCIDYRRLNKKVVKDRFPLPLIEDQIDLLAGAQVYTTIDMRNGFFHIPVEESSRKYTAFITPDGLYEFMKTPFGFCNSPAFFGRFVRDALKELTRNKIVMHYMDDIIIPAANENEGLVRLKLFLEVAEKHGIEINWEKCQFLKRRVEFLGHVIEGPNVSPSPNKIKAVMCYPEPKTVKQLQSFLGLTGFFRKYVENYAYIAKPLTSLLKKDVDFNFDEQQRTSFWQLQMKLSNEPVLRIYDPMAVTELHTDACKDGIASVLMQRRSDEKDFHPVYFYSKMTTPAEANYDSYHLEALAIIRSVEKFRTYLLGIKFKIVTDCQAFEKTLRKKEVPAKVQRWALMLEEYEYEVEHRVASRMRHVDALSRAAVMTIQDKVTDVIIQKQKTDEKCSAIAKLLEDGDYEDYRIDGGIVSKFMNGKPLIFVPECMRRELVRNVHANGHFSAKKIEDIVMQDYYVPNLTKLAVEVVSCCVPCILATRKRGKKEGCLNPIPKGDKPLSTYHIDHLGPMTATSKSYKYLFVVIDAFTKFVWIYPTKTTNAIEVIDRLRIQQNVFGNPDRIVADRGSAFTSNDFKNYCDEEKVQLLHITTGVPQGNGQVERVHQIITGCLTKMALEKPSEWYRFVGRVQKCINSTFQRSTGFSPFELLTGVRMKQATDVSMLDVIGQEEAEIYNEEREKIRNSAKLSILNAQEEQRRNYNKKCKDAIKYDVGQIVAIKKNTI